MLEQTASSSGCTASSTDSDSSPDDELEPRGRRGGKRTRPNVGDLALTSLPSEHYPDAISTAQVADRLGVIPRRVQQLVVAGDLEPVAKRPGLRGAMYFDRVDVERYLAARAGHPFRKVCNDRYELDGVEARCHLAAQHFGPHRGAIAVVEWPNRSHLG